MKFVSRGSEARPSKWVGGGGIGWVLGCVLLLACPGPSRADATLLMEDPINFEGWVTSVGHSAVLMDRLCTDDHVSIRWCRPGEEGAVLSRYPGLSKGPHGQLDWLAMAPEPYFFAVDRPEDVPARVTRAQFEHLQSAWQAAHGASFPVDPGPKGWIQLTGESYRRRIVAIRVHTTPEQDLRLMTWLNERRNVSHFNIFSENCADFVGAVLGQLFPHGFHRSYAFDAGMMTPRQNEANLHTYAMRHKELGWEPMLLPQVPGEMPRSGHLYGVTESYLKHYWFLLPLDALDPFELGAVTGLGLSDHRYVARPTATISAAMFSFATK